MVSFFTLMRAIGFPMKKASLILDSIPKGEGFYAWQEQKKWEAFLFHYNHNESYRRFVGKMPKSWNDIPVIQKEDFKKYNIAIKPSNKNNHKYYIQSTSGSSGTPFIFATDYLNHALTWQLVAKRYQDANILLDELQARFYSIPNSFVKKTEEKIKDFLVNRSRFSITELTDNQLQEWTKKLMNRKYKYIYGYAFPLITFADFLQKQNIILSDVAPSLKSCIITSEMCTIEEHKQIEKSFGVPVYNEYGASELGIIGFGKTGQWEVSDELFYIEILNGDHKPVKDGESGRVICTPFFQKGSPFVKYDIGDLASISTIDGKRYFTRLNGRKETMLKLPSGRKIPGDTLFHIIFTDFCAKHPGLIDHFQAVQPQNNLIEISIVSSQKISPEQENELKKSVDNYLNGEVEVNIKKVREIKRNKNLKFQRFVSLVQ